jgi:hypothetical protein
MSKIPSSDLPLFGRIALALLSLILFSIVMIVPGLHAASSDEVIEAWFGSDDTVRKPLIWKREPAVATRNILDGRFIDPVTAGRNIVAALSAPGIGGKAKRAIAEQFDSFLKTRNENGYWPYPAQGRFPDGWYSNTDFASMALASLALYNAVGGKRYLLQGKELVEQMIRPVSEHGANHATKKAACWLGGVIWPGIADGEQTYILDNALLGIMALETYAAIFPEDGFNRELDCYLDDLQRISSAFVYDDDSWERHMLNPATPLMTRQFISEINQLDALYDLSKRTIYRNLAASRRERFARHFKVFRDGDRFFFSRLGPPHLAFVDAYQTRLVFRDRYGTEIETVDSGLYRPEEANVFMRGPLPSGAEMVDIMAYDGATSTQLVERQRLVAPAGQPPKRVAYTATSQFDMRADGGCFLADPEHSDRNYGRIVLTFDQPVPVPELNLFALDVDVPAQTSWQMVLTMASGKEVRRTVDKPHEGRNLVLLSRLGFSDPGAANDSVVGFKIQINTHAITDPARICLNGVSTFADSFAMAEMVRTEGFDYLLLRH